MKIRKKNDLYNKKGVAPQALREKNLAWQKKVQAPRQSLKSFKPKKK